jgi:hypothetical protein
MNIQVRGVATNPTKASGGNDLVGTLDAGILGGELLLFDPGQQATGVTFTTPAGWSLALKTGQSGTGGTPATGSLYYKQAVLADAGATATLHSNNTAAMTGTLVALYDADGGTLNATLDGTPDKTQTDTDGTTFDSPTTLTTTLANSLVIFTVSIGKTGTTSITPPGGVPTITELGDIHIGGQTTSLNWMVQAAAGAVANRTFTCSGTFDSIVIIVAAFTYTPPATSGARTLVGRQPIATMTEGRLVH